MPDPVGNPPPPSTPREFDFNRAGQTDEASPDDVVSSDVPCTTCGYNLRGLSPRGVCPECQSPVDRALHGDLLRFSEPRWVRTIARGLRLLNISIVLGLVVIIGVALYAKWFGVPWVTSALMLVVGAVAIIGTWLATEREPSLIEREPPLSGRRIVRVLVIAAVALEIADDWIGARFRFGRASMQLLSTGVWIAGIVFAMRYAMSLARRIPNRDLEAHTRTVMWGLIFSYGLAASITALAIANQRMPPVVALVFGLSCTVLVACLIFTVWSLTLTARYAAALSAAADDAQTTWLHALARRELDEAANAGAASTHPGE